MLELSAPWYWWGALLASGALVALHLLARRERPAEALPTARFVPEDVATSAIRIDRIKDAGLLALRTAALLLIGLAAARPTISRHRSATARVILVDRSAYVADLQAAIDSARVLARGAVPVVVAFDSAATVTSVDALDRAASTADVRPAGSLSAAMTLGVRQAVALSDTYERVELHLISPLAESEQDDATVAIRREWPDSLFLHRIPLREEPLARTTVQTPLDDDDPVGAALRLTAPTSPNDAGATVRVVRGAASSADSAWDKSRGRVVVTWPGARSGAGSDTLAAIASVSGTAIGFFRRAPVSLSGTPVVWWSDGSPAATEVSNGDGCLRTVAFSPSPSGDAALSIGVRRMVERLLAPCGNVSRASTLPDVEVRALLATPGKRTPPHGGRPTEQSALPVVLLLLALAALAVDSVWRRRLGASGAE